MDERHRGRCQAEVGVKRYDLTRKFQNTNQDIEELDFEDDALCKWQDPAWQNLFKEWLAGRGPLEDLMTRQECADYLRCDVKLVDKLRERGDLVSFKVGDRHIVITTKSVQAYLARRRAS